MPSLIEKAKIVYEVYAIYSPFQVPSWHLLSEPEREAWRRAVEYAQRLAIECPEFAGKTVP